MNPNSRERMEDVDKARVLEQDAEERYLGERYAVPRISSDALAVGISLNNDPQMYTFLRPQRWLSVLRTKHSTEALFLQTKMQYSTAE